MTQPILDACCGSRMFWFNKKNPNAVFMDKRAEQRTLCDGRTLNVSPDVIGDFTNMPFKDKSFKLVVFDPPHLNHGGKNGWLVLKYGSLPLTGWEDILRKGVSECMRVLDDYGVLIFKWNEQQIPLKKVLDAIEIEPLFGHTTNSKQTTHWMAFMKFPE